MQLTLPRLVLPAGLDNGASLALGNGPSCDDFDLSELDNRDVTVFGYNRSWQHVRVDVMTACQHEFIAEFLENYSRNPCRVLVTASTLARLRGVKPCIEHSLELLPAGVSAIPLQLAMIRGGEVFLLGEDGGLHTDGVPRTQLHSRTVWYDGRLSGIPAYNADMACEKRSTMTTMGVCNRLGVHSNLQLMQQDGVYSCNVRNLSAHGWPALVWGVDPCVVDQTCGRLDRNGPAVAFNISTGNEKVSTLTYHGFSPRSIDWHINVIRGLRKKRPTLPIFVRSYCDVDILRNALEDWSIIVGTLEDTLPTGSEFESLTEIRLPHVA